MGNLRIGCEGCLSGTQMELTKDQFSLVRELNDGSVPMRFDGTSASGKPDVTLLGRVCFRPGNCRNKDDVGTMVDLVELAIEEGELQ